MSKEIFKPEFVIIRPRKDMTKDERRAVLAHNRKARLLTKNAAEEEVWRKAWDLEKHMSLDDAYSLVMGDVVELRWFGITEHDFGVIIDDMYPHNLEVMLVQVGRLESSNTTWVGNRANISYENVIRVVGKISYPEMIPLNTMN